MQPKCIKRQEYLKQDSLKVLSIHPTHIFLNTADLAVYDQAKAYTKDTETLRTFVNNDIPGVRDFLEGLAEAARESGFRYDAIRSITV